MAFYSETIMKSACHVCFKEFKEGDLLQALFAREGEPLEWNKPVHVDYNFQSRFERHPDRILRKHKDCVDTSAPNRP